MSESARYVKIAEWSDEDQCFVGSCPGLFYGGCHGSDEKQVFAELCEIKRKENKKKKGKRKGAWVGLGRIKCFPLPLLLSALGSRFIQLRDIKKD